MPPGVLLGSVDPDPLSGLSWQMRAWRFYGAPDGATGGGGTSALDINSLRSNEGAIGEVRFTLGWVAQQIGRCGWRITLDGEDLESEQSDALIDQVANSDAAVMIATNLLVSGELRYAAFRREDLEAADAYGLQGPYSTGLMPPGNDELVWLPVSVVAPKRREWLDTAIIDVRGLWPHPADPTKPDPPLRGVLDVLAEIEQLQDVAYSQNRSRIAQMGILSVATELDMANTEGGDFETMLEQVTNAQIRDPRKSSAHPIVLRGPADLMREFGGGINWTTPPTAGQLNGERLEDRMRFLITRLSWGFPVPPEILTGMTATNRATAFQIEEQTYRSHIEPIAKLVGRVFAGALRLLLDGNRRVEVEPDPSDLLARRHSVADAFGAYDRGLITAEFVLEVLGIDEEHMATPADLERIREVRGAGSTASDGGPGSATGRPGDRAPERDPADAADDEAVAGAAGEPVDLESLAARLGDLDQALRASLEGAAEMAVVDALSRLGARARTLADRANRDDLPDLTNVENLRVPSRLGVEQLAAIELGPEKVEQLLWEWLAPLGEWWLHNRMPDARNAVEQTVAELGLEIEFDQRQFEISAEYLHAALVEWVVEKLESWPVPGVDSDIVRETVRRAGARS